MALLPHPPAARGHTLLELVAVIAIVTVLATLATPSFRRQLAEAALRTSVQQTQAALHLARQLALTTGSTITACPTADRRRCAFGAPEWMLFRNGPAGTADRRDDDEPLLHTWRLPARVAVWGTRGYAGFLPEIRAAATATFNFCHAAVPQLWRSVVISQTGRIRTTRAIAAGMPAGAPCR